MPAMPAPCTHLLYLHGFRSSPQSNKARLMAARMLDAARHASDGDIAALHALRIDIKRLRYAIEFFSPLLGERQSRQALDALVDAQDQLGFLNDLSQAGPHLLAVAGDDPALLAAVSRIANHHLPRYQKIVGDAPKLLRRLGRMRLPH